MRPVTSLIVVSGALMASGLALAQAPAPQGMSSADVRFAAAAPGIGERVPDLTIVDRNGDPINLRALTRENYTVLVLGCLT